MEPERKQYRLKDTEFDDAQGSFKAVFATLNVKDLDGDVTLPSAFTDGEAVRIAAAWSLANIGQPDSVAPVFKAADVEPGWERIQTTKACLVLAEKLLAAGRKEEAKAMYTLLHNSRRDPAEKYIRDASEKGLAAAR